MLYVTSTSIKKQKPENHTTLLHLSLEAPCTQSPSCLSREKQRRKPRGREHCRYHFRNIIPPCPWQHINRFCGWNSSEHSDSLPLKKITLVSYTVLLTPPVGVKWKHFCADSWGLFLFRLRPLGIFCGACSLVSAEQFSSRPTRLQGESISAPSRGK